MQWKLKSTVYMPCEYRSIVSFIEYCSVQYHPCHWDCYSTQSIKARKTRWEFYLLCGVVGTSDCNALKSRVETIHTNSRHCYHQIFKYFRVDRLIFVVLLVKNLWISHCFYSSTGIFGNNQLSYQPCGQCFLSIEDC